MTIGNQASSVTAQGNGATTSWAFQFLIPTTASCVLQVLDTTVDPETLTTIPAGSFTLSGAGVTAGGTVTYPLSGSPLSSGQYLTIYRLLPLSQTASIANAGNAYPIVIENALDYQAMVSQQLQTALDALEADVDEDVPPAVPTTTSVFGSIVATTASIGNLTGTTASFGTLDIEGLFVDSGFATASVTSGQTLTLSGAINFTAITMTQSAAALTVVLPTSPVDGQGAGFSIDQAVTALTVTSSDATVKNAPVTTSTASAGGTFEWVYDSATDTWWSRERSALAGTSLTYLTASASIGFGTVATGRAGSNTVSVTGSVLGDFVNVAPASVALPDGVFYTGQVSAAGVVTVMYCNISGGSITTGTLAVLVTVYPKSQFGL